VATAALARVRAPLQNARGKIPRKAGMRRGFERFPGILCGALLLAGCSSGIPRHDSQAQIRERYQSYAAPPIDRFTWLGHFYSWESLGNNQLVVYTTPSDAFLLTVRPPCTDLNFSQSIGVTSTAGTVNAQLDSVTVKGWHCPIAEIRRIDMARMRADMKTAAEKAQSGG
jgi:hypothetical protein